jgi:YHS domain-containing protein
MQVDHYPSQLANEDSICPLCGMALLSHQVAASFTYIGQTYVFCSDRCYQNFRRKPEMHLTDLAHETRPHLGYACPHQPLPYHSSRHERI